MPAAPVPVAFFFVMESTFYIRTFSEKIILSRLVRFSADLLTKVAESDYRDLNHLIYIFQNKDGSGFQLLLQVLVFLLFLIRELLVGFG